MMSQGTRQAYADQGDPARRDAIANVSMNSQMFNLYDQIQKYISKNNPFTPDQIFGIMDKMFAKYGNAEMPMFSGKQQQASLARKMGYGTQMLNSLAPLLMKYMDNMNVMGKFNPQYIPGLGGFNTGGQSANIGQIGTPWNGLTTDADFSNRPSLQGNPPSAVSTGLTAANMVSNQVPSINNAITNALSSAFNTASNLRY